MGFIDYPFTPSEYILLNADQFASETGKSDRFSLLLSEGNVSGTELASILITAALLANEGEGSLKMVISNEKSFLGITRSTKLMITPEGIAPNWNSYTLESALLYCANQLVSARMENTVYQTVYTLLRENSKNPWVTVVNLVEWGLVSSNWLIPVEGEAAAAFSIPFICPGKVRDLVLSQPADPYVDLLLATKNSQPDIWKMMQAEISQAFADRKM